MKPRTQITNNWKRVGQLIKLNLFYLGLVSTVRWDVSRFYTAINGYSKPYRVY